MAIEILYHLYSLTPKNRLNSKVESISERKGALILVNGGYSVIHPWPELGDLPLEEQLSTLRAGGITPLLSRALHYLEIDCEARRDSRSLFDSLVVPPSHKLVLHLSSLQDDSLNGTYKLKIGINLRDELRMLNDLAPNASTKFRLDANAALNREEAILFWRSLSDKIKQKVEFFEDPTRYDEALWRELSQDIGMPLAYDQYGENGSDIREHYSTRVIKPLIQDCATITAKESARNRKIVVTTSLDHPFGQRIAMYEAAIIGQNFPDTISVCGLSSHSAYESNPFSEAIDKVSGTGFGFDDLLERIEWKKL